MNSVVLYGVFVLIAVTYLARFGGLWHAYDRMNNVRERFRIEISAKSWVLTHALCWMLLEIAAPSAAMILDQPWRALYGLFVVALMILNLAIGYLSISTWSRQASNLKIT